jgi:hypothetical protein
VMRGPSYVKDELYAVMENPGVKWMLLDARNQQSTCCCWVGKFYPFQILVPDFVLEYIYIIFQLWSLCRFVVRIYAFVVASVRLQFHVSATCCQVHTPSHISSNHQPAINPRVGLRMFLYVLLSSGKRLQFANWKITKSSRAWQVNYFYVHFQYPK